MRQRLSIAFLVVFVFVDVYLVSLALRHASHPVTSSAGVRAKPVSPSSDASGSPTDTASPSALTAPTYLDVDADGLALRSTRGSCDSGAPAQVAVSQDEAATFVDRDVSNLGETLRVTVEPAGKLSIVGLTESCAVARWTSTTQGKKWTQTTGAAGRWYLAPDQTDSAIVSARGRRSVPCVPVSLSSIGTGVVRVLCDQGQILATSDAGTSWVTLGRLPGAVSIRFTTPSAGVALVRQDGCRAAVLESSDGGSRWSRQTCLTGGAPLAVAAAGDLVVAQRSEAVDVSTDAGATWPAG